jgi:hypothetical protein
MRRLAHGLRRNSRSRANKTHYLAEGGLFFSEIRAANRPLCECESLLHKFRYLASRQHYRNARQRLCEHRRCNKCGDSRAEPFKDACTISFLVAAALSSSLAPAHEVSIFAWFSLTGVPQICAAIADANLLQTLRESK